MPTTIETAERLHLLLADADAAAARTLATALRGLGHAVTVVADGRDALAAIGRDRFDAALFDRMLPREGGVPLVRTLRRGGMTIPVVLLSAMTDAEAAIAALSAGADDHVATPADAGEIAARVAAILRGQRWSASGADTLRAGDIVVNPAGFRAWRGGRLLDLGRLEFRLLVELVRARDTVSTRAALVERVWGSDVDPRSNIVDAHIRRLRAKLVAGGGADPIATVRGVGYALRG